MQKILLYLILIITYLGLSKGLSPSELGMDYVPNERGLAKAFTGENVSIILIDMHATGFLIKTYYQKYRVVHGFQGIEEVIVRTSRDFAKKNRENVGLSIFRRSEEGEETLPMPPGASFIGNRGFGEWRPNKYGVPKWRFYRAYKNLPTYLGWGKWSPDQLFFDEYIAFRERNQPYYGSNKEFGTQGAVTQKNFPNYFKPERQKRIEVKTFLLKYFRENF